MKLMLLLLFLQGIVVGSMPGDCLFYDATGMLGLSKCYPFQIVILEDQFLYLS